MVVNILVLTTSFEENIRLVKDSLPIDQSFDIIGRNFKIGDKDAYLVFIDGFAKDDIMLFILQDLQKLYHYATDSTTDITNITQLIKSKVAYIEVDTFQDLTDMNLSVLSGAVGLIVEGESEGIIIDAREYPSRSPENPESEKVTRGAKDGLVETVVLNTALIRRRIRDEKLIFEIKNIGSRSKTDVVIGYVDDLVDKAVLQKVYDKLDAISVNSLVMAEQTLEELLMKKKWYNPLPQVRYTERPDIIAAHLMEGYIVIITDTSPCAMILPTTFFSFVQYAEDYYQNPVVGTYYRGLRLIAILLSLILIPSWMLISLNADKLPQALQFIGAEESSVMPLFVQFLILEFGMDLLKLSSLHTPSFLGASFSIIGGLLIGDIAVQVGLFVTEAVFYTAVSAMLTYCIPNIELASAIRLFRLGLLILTGLFGIFGFIFALMVILAITYSTQTIDKKYMWPLLPLNIKALKAIILRRPASNKN